MTKTKTETVPFDQWLMELERGLKIRRNALDEGCMEQADLLYRVSDALALAISDRDALKKRIKEMEAERFCSILADVPPDGKKPTEKAIEALIVCDPAIQRMRTEMLETELEIGRMTALRDSFADRSHMLRTMQGLYTTQYWGSDTSPSIARRPKV